MYVMEVNIRPSLREKYGTTPQKNVDPTTITKSEKLANERRDKQIIKEMWYMVAYGLSIFLGGFGIWALDRAFCSQLRSWRHNIGLPWGILLEGHGWWHIMTGIGSYFYIVWAIWLRYCLNDKQDKYMLYWTRVWKLPEVVPISEVMQAAGNRSSRKLKPSGYVNGMTRSEDTKSF